MEEAGSSPCPESPGGLTEQEGDIEAGLLDVDLDSYQTTLEEVLTWLLSAEDTLQVQDEVSDDVEEVKEQFHTHEVGWQPAVFTLRFTDLHLYSLTLKNKLQLCRPSAWWQCSESCRGEWCKAPHKGAYLVAL